jgi:hypothetical protein
VRQGEASSSAARASPAGPPPITQTSAVSVESVGTSAARRSMAIQEPARDDA